MRKSAANPEIERLQKRLTDTIASADESSARHQKLISDLWEIHGKPYTSAHPGFGGRFDFFCSSCRTPWPCPTAKRVLQEGQVGEPVEYEPLRLIEKRGER